MKYDRLFHVCSQTSFCLMLTITLLGCGLAPMSLKMSPTDTVAQLLTSSLETLSPSSTFTEQPTSTPTGTTTSTPIPTPMGEDVIGKLKYLLETNGHCSLPCWWGIIPGRTKAPEVNAYLGPLATSISQADLSPARNDLYSYVVRFSNPINQKGYWQVEIFADRLREKRDTIEAISAPAGKALPELLADLGIPDDVWINEDVFPGSEPTYTLVLYYNMGVMLENFGQYRIDSDYSSNICPTQFLSPNEFTSWVWDTSMFKTFNEVGTLEIIPSMASDHYFRRIGDVSGMTPKTFYNTYKNPSATECIKMPPSAFP